MGIYIFTSQSTQMYLTVISAENLKILLFVKTGSKAHMVNMLGMKSVT